MPVSKCPHNEKWRIGSGPCIYDTQETATAAYQAYLAQKNASEPTPDRIVGPTGIVGPTIIRTFVALPGDPRSEIELVPAGAWNHPIYGKFNVTAADLRQFEDNFNQRVYGQDVALDIEHQPSPEGAPGWIMSVRADDQRLYGRIEWTDYGERLLAQHRFRYISPEFYPEYTRAADGLKFRNVLTSAALTNRPFFKDLAPVTMMETGEQHVTAPVNEVRVFAGWGDSMGGNTMADDVTNNDQVSVTQAATAQTAGAGPGSPAPAGSSPSPTAQPIARSAPVTPKPDRIVGPTGVAQPIAGSAPVTPKPDRIVGPTGVAQPIAGSAPVTPEPDRIVGPTGGDEARRMYEHQQATIQGLEQRVALGEYREARAAVMESIRAWRFGEDQRGIIAPAQREALADFAMRFSDVPDKSVGPTGATAQISERQRFLDLIKGLVPVPMGARGFVAQEGQQSPEGELDTAARKKMTEIQGMTYGDAVRAVIAENPGLAQRGIEGE
jgi:hypothetical protein